MTPFSYPKIVVRDTPAQFTNITDNQSVPVTGTSFGAMNVALSGGGSGTFAEVVTISDASGFAVPEKALMCMSVIGGLDPNNLNQILPTEALPIANYATPGINAGLTGNLVATAALTGLFDGSANYVAAHALSSAGGNQAPSQAGLQGVVARLQVYDPVSDKFNRLESGGNDADGILQTTQGVADTRGFLYGFNLTNWDRITSQGNSSDGWDSQPTGYLTVAAFPFGFNGTTFDRTRTPNVFKTVAVTASGNTTIWTPAAGKKFRLMGGTISASGTAAALVADLLKLQDGAGGTNIIQFMIAINTTVTGDTQIPFTLGNGYLSGAINTVLNANLATALTGGNIIVNVYGTEE